ncbi:glycosyltransferase [Roseococcus pinisoli]|uniref:Glycosyltransferase n=1 Tax=Roseococcus pinisoli TaxID=2835040 RepID=A0ABS5QJB8_9PROT|nr:glycosyltransferase [Roseococcus pinisoli]MBS7813461.1 glycosyltransferase [Roseococcus pinisoli]
MTGTPRFSVLLPTHNRADVLGFAIQSVLAQTEPDFELLVVADGCTDGTRDVMAAFEDPRIRFFDLPKAPHFGYANRNLALREARGRLIAFAAHDDLLLPDHLALMGDLLDSEGASWGYSRPLWVSTDGVIVPFATDLGLPGGLQDFHRGNTIPAACVVHTKEALHQAGFWPEDVPAAADWVLWRRMLGIGALPPAYLRQPTNLHFSADWKKSRFSASAEVERLVGIADAADWWPGILRHPPIMEVEQATLWRVMRAGGEPWVAGLRSAVSQVLDRIAWTAIRETLPGLDAARVEVAGAQAREAAALAQLDEHRQAMECERQARMNAEAASMRGDAVRAELDACRAREAAALAQLDGHRQAMECERQARMNAEAASLRGDAVRAELDASRAREAEALAELEGHRQAIGILRASTSWRVTAPLRRLGQMLRREPSDRS